MPDASVLRKSPRSTRLVVTVFAESQLGLTLRDAEAPVEILVIEHVERPTDN